MVYLWKDKQNIYPELKKELLIEWEKTIMLNIEQKFNEELNKKVDEILEGIKEFLYTTIKDSKQTFNPEDTISNDLIRYTQGRKNLKEKNIKLATKILITNNVNYVLYDVLDSLYKQHIKKVINEVGEDLDNRYDFYNVDDLMDNKGSLPTNDYWLEKNKNRKCPYNFNENDFSDED